MNTVADKNLLPAWADSVHDAQTTFRSILAALSEPGSIQRLPVQLVAPGPLHSATTAVCLALADYETPLWLSAGADIAAVQSYLRFHCGCPLVDAPGAAIFAVILDGEAGIALEGFAQGSMEYPDRSATLLIQVPALDAGPARRISGPGIATTRELRVGGLPPDFDAQWRGNTAAFPLGVDLIFCCGNAIVGLPRTTQIHD